MTLIDSFERMFIINLPERQDRRRFVTEELAACGTDVDGLKVRFIEAIRPTYAAGWPSIGARGCWMSHLKAIRMARGLGMEHVLIAEDDVMLSSTLARPLPEMSERIARGGWDFAYLGHIEPLSGDPASPAWQTSAEPLVCAHLYALHWRVFDPLIAYLEECMARYPGDPRGGPMHVDAAFTMFRAQHPDCVTLIANPSLASQRRSRSDIQQHRWYDRTPGFRQLAMLARESANRLRTAS